MAFNADPPVRTVSLRRPSSHRPTLGSPSEALEPLRAPEAPRRRRVIRDAEPSRARGVIAFLNGMVTCTLFALVLGWFVVDAALQRFDAPGLLEKSTLFAVKEGETTRSVVDRLVSKELGIFEPTTENGMVLRGTVAVAWLGSWLGLQPREGIKAGEYELPKAASMRQVMAILNRGVSIQFSITIPEGLTSEQIVERLRANQSLTGEIPEVPAEGTLMPQTYKFSRGDTRQSILDRMQATHAKLTKEIWEKRDAGTPLKSVEELAILASIVEKETGRPDERDRVAAVFVNRLKIGQPLASDPTILYGLYKGAVQWGKPILKSEIDSRTSHNTYHFKGLPPTPICNPGLKAMEAVLNPAKTDDLFFVADGNGRSVFSKTYSEHLKNVRELRRVEAERNLKLQQQTNPAPQPAVAPQTTTPKPAVAPKPAPTANQPAPKSPAKPKPPATTQPPPSQ